MRKDKLMVMANFNFAILSILYYFTNISFVGRVIFFVIVVHLTSCLVNLFIYDVSAP